MSVWKRYFQWWPANDVYINLNDTYEKDVLMLCQLTFYVHQWGALADESKVTTSCSFRSDTVFNRLGFARTGPWDSWDAPWVAQCVGRDATELGQTALRVGAAWFAYSCVHRREQRARGR